MDVSDTNRLFASVASKGGGHTESDKYATGDVTFPAQVVTMALDPSPSRAGDQRIKTITRQTHQCEQQTEEGDLEHHRAARGIDELRQEGQEEQRRLRIQQKGSSMSPSGCRSCSRMRAMNYRCRFAT